MTVRELINSLMDVYDKDAEIELLYDYEDEEDGECIMGFEFESIQDSSYSPNDKVVFFNLKFKDWC